MTMHATATKASAQADTAQPESAGKKTAVTQSSQQIPLWTNATLPAIQFSLKVNAPNDKYEREADRVADAVMRMPEAAVQRRTCACGKAAGPNGMCEDCKRKQLSIQRKATGEATQPAASLIVHQVLQQPGQRLDSPTRNFMEARFGQDFGGVRVHTGAAADLATHYMQARAFTVGSDVVFGREQYAPQSMSSSRRLLAHELAHVVQQSGFSHLSTKAVIQRACLPESECKLPQNEAVRVGSAKKFGEEMTKQAEPEQAERRNMTPEQARSGLHSHRAKAIEQLFQKHLPQLRPLVHGVFVDETLPADADAMRSDCLKWARKSLPPGSKVPEFEGAVHGCIFVPAKLERQAAKYNSVKTPNFRLMEWMRWAVLRTLIHETTHERFLGANIEYPTDRSCTEKTLAIEISELSAVISEFPIVNELSEDLQNTWFNHHLQDPTKRTGESISGSVRDIRCNCECTDADAMIRAAFDLAATSWTEAQKRTFHAQMKRGKGKDFGVYWPYDASRIGRTGRHELSLTTGLGFSGSDKLKVGMLTYRFVLWNWANGRLGLSGGLQLNPVAIFQSDPKGEFGAVTGGLRFVSEPVSRKPGFGGLTGRIETGFGAGSFSLKPADPQIGETKAIGKDWVLQVGAGIQFYIPRFTSLQPVSIEAAYRLTQPLGPEARRIQTASLSFTLPL